MIVSDFDNVWFPFTFFSEKFKADSIGTGQTK